MRVLLVEDDYAVSQSIETMLKKEGMIVDTTDLGEDGLDIGNLYDYAIIILDLMLPDMNGYEVLKSLRAAKVNTPVLILSGLSEPDKKVKGLGYGADDYLTKPFDKAELLARLQAVVRRSNGHLTGKEYGIMELLSLRKGSPLNKDQFLNHLYGGIDEPELKIIDVFICKLRKKLEKASGGKNYIETVWGRGYVLRDPDELPKKK